MRYLNAFLDNNDNINLRLSEYEHFLPKGTLEILATKIYSNTNSTQKVNLANSDSDYYTISDDLASYVRNKNYVRDTRDAYNLFHPIPHNLHDVFSVAGLDQHEMHIFTKREYRGAFTSCCEKAYYIDNNGNSNNVFTQAQIDDLKNWFKTLPDNHILINMNPLYPTKRLESIEDTILQIKGRVKDFDSSLIIAFVSSLVITAVVGYNVGPLILELCSTAFASSIITILLSFPALRAAFPDRHISPLNLVIEDEEQEVIIHDLLLNIPENVQGMGVEFYDLSANASDNNIESNYAPSTNGFDQGKIANENVLKNTHTPNTPNTTLHNDSPLSETKLNSNPNTQDRSISD
jgi:hypothetical protein